MILHIKRVGKMNPPIDRENYNVFMGIFIVFNINIIIKIIIIIINILLIFIIVIFNIKFIVIIIIIIIKIINKIEIEWNAIKRTKVLLETLTPTFNEYLYF